MPVKSAPGKNKHYCEYKKSINNHTGSHFATGYHSISVSQKS